MAGGQWASPEAAVAIIPERATPTSIVHNGSELGTISVTRYANGTWLIGLQGEHDISTAPLLDEAAREIWLECRLLVVDFRSASFIDCSIIGWLLQTRDALADVGTCALRVVVGGRGEGVVPRIFDAFELRDQFACYPTREQALTAVPDVTLTEPSQASACRWWNQDPS